MMIVRRALRRPVPLLSTALITGACLALAAVLLHVAALVVRPALGVASPEKVVALYGVDPLSGRERSLSRQEVDALRLEAASLETVAGYVRLPVELHRGGRATPLTAEVVSPDYFAVLGVDAPTPFDDPQTVLLSARAARRLDVARGDTLILNDAEFVVSGLLPEAFVGVNFDWHQAPDVWLPLATLRSLHPGFATLDDGVLAAAPMLVAVARERVNVPRADTLADVERVLRGITPAGASPGHVSRVIPIENATTWPGRRQQLQRSLLLVAVVSLLALLIGVATYVAYLSSVVIEREREMALRIGVGATGRQLAGEVLGLMVPAAVLSAAVAASVAWLVAGYLATALSVLGVPALAPAAASATLRLSVILGGLLVVALAVSCVVSIRRVVRMARTPSRVLRAAADDPASSLRLGVVAVQVALAAVIAVPAAQHTAAWRASFSESPGFDTTHLTLVDLDMDHRRVSVRVAADDLVQQLRQHLPAAAVTVAAFGPWSSTAAPGRASVGRDAGVIELPVEFNAVGRDYLEVLGLPLVAGRSFADAGPAENVAAVVTNRTLAESLGGVAAALGTRLELAGTSGYEGTATIVGVVADATYHGPWESPVAMVYRPLTNLPPHATLIVRGRGVSAAAIDSAVHDVIASRIPGASARAATPWSHHVRALLVREQVLAVLLAVLAIVAVAAANVGTWSTLREHLRAARRPTAIRVALGATFRWLVGPTLGRPLAVVCAALAAGVVAGLLLGQRVVSVEPRPGIWMWTALVLALLLALQLLSGALVAWRLRAVNPAPLLRHS